MLGSTVQAPHLGGGRFIIWPLTLIVLILGCALFGDRGIVHMLQLSSQKDKLVLKLEALNDQNEALRYEIDSLRHDRRYIERVARTELGMVRDDERVFQFTSKP